MDRFDKLKNLLFLKLAVIYLRYLIGFAFAFAAVVKIKGERFTSIQATEPIGYFFDAMFKTGVYWNFLGWSQFIAGALLMTQRFATVGALLFLPIILNVFVITHAIDFGMGTPLITTFMLLGTVFLVLWDYKKWFILFKRDHEIYLNLTHQPADNFMNHPLWIITGIIFVGLAIIPWTPGFDHFKLWVGALLATGVVSFLIALFFLRKHLISGRSTASPDPAQSLTSQTSLEDRG